MTVHNNSNGGCCLWTCNSPFLQQHAGDLQKVSLYALGVFVAGMFLFGGMMAAANPHIVYLHQWSPMQLAFMGGTAVNAALSLVSYLFFKSLENKAN